MDTATSEDMTVGTDECCPGVEFYLAAGHDQATAEALAGLDEMCASHARAQEALGPEGRARLEEAYERHGRMLDADPQVRGEREAGRLAMEAFRAAREKRESAEVARKRAQEACGRSELRFDFAERAEELRREAFTAPDRTGARVSTESAWVSNTRGARTQPRARQRRETGGRRSSSGGGDSGDDGPADEPPARRRLCALCGRDIPADRSPKADHCSNTHAAAARKRRQRARKRDRAVSPRTATPDFLRMQNLESVELQRLLGVATCRCSGHHRTFSDDPEHCQRCGRCVPGSRRGLDLRRQLDALRELLGTAREAVVA